jgi:hypothetical protein
MALKLVIKNSFSYNISKGDKARPVSCDIPLDVESLTATLCLKNMSSGYIGYKFSLQDVSFHKKMYQPTKVVASIKIESTSSVWAPISKTEMDKIFKNRKVVLFDNTDVPASATIDDIPDANKVGLDYYVQEVQTCYMKDSMVVTLKIYSPDKKLTLEKNSRTFVSKQMSEILSSVMTTEKISYSSDKMKVLSYMGKDSSNNNIIREHIFPYLVQYNESFYDMLARTCNRWGEFLFYENEQLNVGYSFNDTSSSDTESSEATVINASSENFKNYTYIDLSKHTFGDNFHRSANYDDSIIDSPYKKSPNKVEGILFSPGEKWDTMLVNKFASFLKNDKTLPAWICNELIDDFFALASKSATVSKNNSDFDTSYFSSDAKKKMPTQYGQYEFKVGKDKKEKKEGFNPFSEISSKFVDTLYKTILSREQKAGEGAVSIDFDTTFPGLKLGQVIAVNSEYFIVVQIDCKPVYNNGVKPKYIYQVIATPQSDTKVKICIKEKDKINPLKTTLKEKEVKIFYPTMLPSGHVRFADPQMAKVTNTKDPLNKGRVRVLFTWQDKKEESSPWLQYAANASGQSGISGKHYADDNVFVGYLDGNVERPYVIGAISKGAGSDIQCVSPGGHSLKLNDDPAGVTKFMTGMFLPGWKTLSSFVPQMNQIETDMDADSKLGGGFELTDNYGIYKISGSTDGRNVTVASPWGDVKINAFTGISIIAPNGDISIKGKNVSIEAGNNLTLTSGTNVKNRLWDGTWSGFASNIGGEIAAAVAKKLVDIGLNLVTVDLTIVRNVFDIVFRPVEGKLLVKSNRYLMLESGKGECVYPEEAFKEGKEREKAIKKRTENDIRPGLYLASGIVEIAQKIDNIGDKICDKWIEQYNNCVSAKGLLEDEMKSESTLKKAKGYKGDVIPICKSYNELKDSLWNHSDTELTDPDLGFDEKIYSKSDKESIDDKLLNDTLTLLHFDKKKPSQVEAAKGSVLKDREQNRDCIVDLANDLREEILKLKQLTNDGISEDEIKQVLATVKSKNVTNDLKSAVIKAFDKTKLGDTLFFNPIPDTAPDKKDLAAILNKSSVEEDRKILKQKAAILWLEAIGFKEEWREAVPVRDGSGNIPDKDVKAKPNRPFNSADFTNAWVWSDYLDSLTSVPKLSTVQWKVAKELMKSWKGYLDKIYFWKNISENMSWGDAKSGGILFSSNENTMQLKKDGNVEAIPTIAKEKLTDPDDHDVKSFLNTVREAMKDFK